MKNRCIIVKYGEKTMFICLGENDSVVASNEAYEIKLYSLHGDDTFTLKTFPTSERGIKDRLYDRLCYYLQYREASVLNSRGEPCTINTFDVEQQIDEIKKSLDK